MFEGNLHHVPPHCTGWCHRRWMRCGCEHRGGDRSPVRQPGCPHPSLGQRGRCGGSDWRRHWAPAPGVLYAAVAEASGCPWQKLEVGNKSQRVTGTWPENNQTGATGSSGGSCPLQAAGTKPAGKCVCPTFLVLSLCLLCPHRAGRKL